MEMVLNNEFCEMTNDELKAVDGGANAWLVAGVATVGVVAIACAPAVGLGMVVVGGASTVVGAGTAAGLVGGGCLAIGAVNHAN